jgi:hypothetical protein
VLPYADLGALLGTNQEMELKLYKEISLFLVKRLRVLTVDVAQAREIRKR